MIPAIKESNQLKEFLGIKEQYPEFYNEAIQHIKPSSSISSSMQFLDLGKHQEGVKQLKSYAKSSH
jgi:phage anti-repressor protein